jgi:hypothetical protein
MTATGWRMPLSLRRAGRVPILAVP